MKTILFLFGLTFFINASAQVVDSIPLPSGYTPSQLHYKNILRVSPDDHVWIGFRSIGLGEFDGVSWRIYNDTNGLPSNWVKSIAFNDSIKWIGTNKGLVKTDGTNFQLFNSLNSPLPSDVINYLFQDDSLLWIATDSGAVSFDGFNWAIYDSTNSAFRSNRIFSYNKNSFGLYATTIAEIYQFKNNSWKTIGYIPGDFLRITNNSTDQLFNGSFQILDTLLIQIELPNDPCFYGDNFLVYNNHVFGGKIPNKTYLITDYYNYPNYLLELDSFNVVKKSFKITYAEFFNAFNSDRKLFDFNSVGEFISSPSGIKHFYKVNLSLPQPMMPPDSCPYLDINQVTARVWNNGGMFWDLEGQSLYEVPAGTGNTAIFAEGLWVGGKDNQGKLHLAAQTYRQSGSDFWPGPLDTTNATIDSSGMELYDKIWKVDRFTILDFIVNFQNGNVSNGIYPIPEIILNWPAHGTGNFSRNLAPFVDTNHDGIYNPILGDYPDIKGDQMLWWVFNDNFSQHSETGAEYNLGVEIHGSAYAFSCQQLTNKDSVINYTTFYHYDIINRSDTDYHEVYFGIYTDVDLGHYLDDLVGCDTINDYGFAYNGDDFDDFIFQYNQFSYGLHPPMINLALLEGPEATPNDGLDNNHDGVIDEPGEHCMMNYFIYWNSDPTSIGNPNDARDYYWRMQGLWLDSTHITYGGTGYDPGNTNYTNYMFSGPQYDTLTGWSETHPCNGCQPNEPSDRRIFVSSGPFDLPAHGKRSIDYAYVFTREPNATNGPNTSIALNHDQVMRIKQFFNTDSFPCSHLIGIDEIQKEEIVYDLYPNPANSEITVTLKNANASEKFYSITDILGREITGSRKIKSSTFRINVQSMSAGLYFISIRSKNGMNVKKFVVKD